MKIGGGRPGGQGEAMGEASLKPGAWGEAWGKDWRRLGEGAWGRPGRSFGEARKDPQGPLTRLLPSHSGCLQPRIKVENSVAKCLIRPF